MASKNKANTDVTTCESEIERMLKNSQTKIIVPVVTLGLLTEYLRTDDPKFDDAQIKRAYNQAVKTMKQYLGHDVHIGAKYYDAYGSRMSRYGVLQQIAHLKYELSSVYAAQAKTLCEWLPLRMKQHIDARLGIIPLLSSPAERASLAELQDKFLDVLQKQISTTPTNFEIFTFAIIKVHLEKFACKIYRDTRTSARDNGVDLSTNFGVVYQVKRLRIHSEAEAAQVYAELKVNFDKERLQDGNVILVIDDISKQIKQYFIDMKVQSISKSEVIRLAMNFDDPEDRQKVLRIIYEEFRRDYSSRVT